MTESLVMTETAHVVRDAASLLDALERARPRIEIGGRIGDLQSIKLPPGTSLHGHGDGAELRFKAGQPGLLLSANNEVAGLRLVTDDTQIAMGLSDEEDDLGELTISDIRTVGRFHLEGSRARRGTLKLTNIHVERADARMAAHRPAGFGVEVLLGGISIYNFSKNPASRWTLEARNLSGGSKDQPLRGSGVFVFGGWFIPIDADPGTAPAPTQEGGTIDLAILTTGEVHSDGGIAAGIGNLITGGVFIGSGVHARAVVDEGTTTTYGQNDMVLDNWGRVDTWTAKADVKSLGSSGIGFVNFGDIDTLKIDAPIETHGLGARGFNLYDGSLNRAEFQSITTYGDGAIGVQLSKPFGSIEIAQDVRTKGGEGDSLVRGKVVHLKAHAVSLKPGARGKEIRIAGQVVAENDSVSAWEFAAPQEVIGLIEVGGQRLTA
jgi:hypothetical protein